MLSTMLSISSCVPLLRVHTSTLTPLQTMATMKPISQSEHLTGQEFYSKNKALKRPISPHLTINKFQLTSMFSITHRGQAWLSLACSQGGPFLHFRIVINYLVWQVEKYTENVLEESLDLLNTSYVVNENIA